MIKIMLVEDDKSLREIYGVRLLAEGYDIVSAGDGEEALAMAIKERPKLIVSDVMMPKISGFDMLDILRSTTETRDIKVIMMTALSSEEQRKRGETLGADRYLVKSQVGIEDVVRVVHEVLGDQEGDGAAKKPAAVTPPPAAPAEPAKPTAPAGSSSIPVPTSLGGTPEPPKAADPVAPPTHAVDPTATPKPSSIKTRIITPLNDPATQPVDINELLDKELAKEAGITEADRPTVATTDQEKAIVNEQLSQFSVPGPDAAAGEHVGEISISDDGNITTPGDGPSTPSAPLPPPPPPPATGV